MECFDVEFGCLGLKMLKLWLNVCWPNKNQVAKPSLHECFVQIFASVHPTFLAGFEVEIILFCCSVTNHDFGWKIFEQSFFFGSEIWVWNSIYNKFSLWWQNLVPWLHCRNISFVHLHGLHEKVPKTCALTPQFVFNTTKAQLHSNFLQLSPRIIALWQFNSPLVPLWPN